MTPRKIFSLQVAALLLSPAMLASVAAAEGTSVVATHGAWKVHVNESTGGKICFIASEPKERKVQVANRATSLVYVTSWPKEAVAAEVSAKMGYAIKEGSKVALTIGEESFRLSPKDERAYVPAPEQEAKLIEAMKKGSDMTVQGVPARGQMTTDIYSLAGISEALKALAAACK